MGINEGEKGENKQREVFQNIIIESESESESEENILGKCNGYTKEEGREKEKRGNVEIEREKEREREKENGNWENEKEYLRSKKVKFSSELVTIIGTSQVDNRCMQNVIDDYTECLCEHLEKIHISIYGTMDNFNISFALMSHREEICLEEIEIPESFIEYFDF